MGSSFTQKELEEFYSRINKISPLKVCIYTILTLGIYFINWIFRTNQSLEYIDEEAPDAKRGIVILFVLPIFLILFTIILELLIFPNQGTLTGIIEIVSWGLFTFLSLKYLYDFCESFGKVTKSSGLTWYIFIYLGYYSIILYIFGVIYTVFLILFPLFTLPAMQAILNKKAEDIDFKNKRNRFNYSQRSYNSRN